MKPRNFPHRRRARQAAAKYGKFVHWPDGILQWVQDGWSVRTKKWRGPGQQPTA